jgi:hypothetical protein
MTEIAQLVIEVTELGDWDLEIAQLGTEIALMERKTAQSGKRQLNFRQIQLKRGQRDS